jgi:hypothetical protein
MLEWTGPDALAGLAARPPDIGLVEIPGPDALAGLAARPPVIELVEIPGPDALDRRVRLPASTAV